MAMPGKSKRALAAVGAILAVVAGVLVVRSLLGDKAVVVQLGSAVTTADGRVTVYSWMPVSDAPGSDGGGPVPTEIDVQSCRAQAGGAILNATGFHLEMPDGRRVNPTGSRLYAADKKTSCVKVAIAFTLPAGSAPRYVTFISGSSTGRWVVSPQVADEMGDVGSVKSDSESPTRILAGLVARR